MTQTPENTDSYALTRYNALRHGVLVPLRGLAVGRARRNSSSSWRRWLPSMGRTGRPRSTLVEEIAGVIWRKRRLRMGEAAIHRDRLAGRSRPSATRPRRRWPILAIPMKARSVADAIRATDADTAETIAAVDDNQRHGEHAMELLGGNDGDAYRARWQRCPKKPRSGGRSRLRRSPRRGIGMAAVHRRGQLAAAVLGRRGHALAGPNTARSWRTARWCASRRSASRRTPTSSSASAATRCTSTASSSGC